MTIANVGIFEDNRIWYHHRPLTLITNDIFRCSFSKCECSGFSYKPNDYHFSDVAYCLRCATLPHSFTYQAHTSHHIFFDKKYKGQCSACGGSDGYFMWRCMHCDICEEGRDPKKLWFYRCEVCDTAVHPKCLLGEYPFIKPRSYFTSRYHPHPLTFVQKIYDYSQCVECGEPCEDLSAECVEHGCNYIGHWKCIKPVDFGKRFYSNSGSNDGCSLVGDDARAIV